MNPFQLISKINTRIEDLAGISQQVLQPNAELTNLEKELLKSTCSDLFELILKLKTTTDTAEKQIFNKETVSSNIKNEINLKEILNNENLANESINSIAEKTTASLNEMEVTVPEISNSLEAEKIDVGKNETQVSSESTPVISQQVFETSEPISPPEIEQNTASLQEETPEIVSTLDALPENSTEVILQEETIKSETIIEPNIEVGNNNESKSIFEDIKEKIPFFSIGKTVMPKNEPSLNERLAMNTSGFQLSEKIIEPKIDSLKTAISLNKKIAFVNDLFKENVVEYAKSIDKLNNANSLNEALVIWGELKIQHNWDFESELVKDLESLIQRRFQ
jgi:hypothetical protein